MLRQEVEFKKIFPALNDIYILRSESIEFTRSNIGKFAVLYIVNLIAALKGGLIDTLVTDSLTIDSILESI